MSTAIDYYIAHRKGYALNLTMLRYFQNNGVGAIVCTSRLNMALPNVGTGFIEHPGGEGWLAEAIGARCEIVHIATDSLIIINRPYWIYLHIAQFFLPLPGIAYLWQKPFMKNYLTNP
ncbi:hypothetical protein HORIV_21190 [Vreelandella olivaria]|uniref:Uncharacterized protein n=1 Tax=Vreelandella olivaria TaxID=390919 RepID=A0ABM7GH37_9GAMM|nr:hypothetical protein HORIV_21190 [Halomonas olivaria]